MALVQFASLPRPVYSDRSVADSRLEQAVGYLDGATLGINGMVLNANAFASTPPIWSPGLSTFTGLLVDVGNAHLQVILEILDPVTQAVVIGFIVAPPIVLLDTTTSSVFEFGTASRFDSATPSQAAFVWLCWHLLVGNLDVIPATVTLELFANARASG